MKLVGFSLWRSAEGEIHVTFPSRAFGLATERRFFDYLRSYEGNAADGRAVKEWILAEYQLAKNGEPAPAPAVAEPAPAPAKSFGRKR